MLRSRRPRTDRAEAAAVTVSAVLALGLALAGCSLGADGAAPGPAAASLPVAPDTTFVSLAPDPDAAPDGGLDADLAEPSAPGPLEPGERPHPWTLGDDADLDGLWRDCQAGSGSACDRLFDAAPVGSDYERFGLTCGDRPDLVDCTDLDHTP